MKQRAFRAMEVLFNNPVISARRLGKSVKIVQGDAALLTCVIHCGISTFIAFCLTISKYLSSSKCVGIDCIAIIDYDSKV